MSTNELKELLIEKIKNTEDEVLGEAYRCFAQEIDDTEIYELSDEQKSEINKARLEIKENKFLTNEQANKEIDEWLNK
ncbi:MAG: hypothetical protein ACR2FN_10730 [Chitinophagaceae bacterium]